MLPTRQNCLLPLITYSKVKQLWLHLRLDCGFNTKVTHDAQRYLEWPSVFDTHYRSITRTRQAWTYFPFRLYNLNKDLHYTKRILRHLLGCSCPGLHSGVTSQLSALLHVPVKPWLSTSDSTTATKWAVAAQSHCTDLLSDRKYSVRDRAFENRSRWGLRWSMR